MKIDRDARELFAVDSGGNRVLVVDIDAGERGDSLTSREYMVEHYAWLDPKVETFVDGAAVGMQLPSGLALYQDGDQAYVLVSDNALGTIFAFDRSGALVDELDLGVGPGALMGIDVAADGSIVGVDAVRDQIWRLAPK